MTRCSSLVVRTRRGAKSGTSWLAAMCVQVVEGRATRVTKYEIAAIDREGRTHPLRRPRYAQIGKAGTNSVGTGRTHLLRRGAIAHAELLDQILDRCGERASSAIDDVSSLSITRYVTVGGPRQFTKIVSGTMPSP